MPVLARRLALLAVLALAAAGCGDGASSPGATADGGAGPVPAAGWRTATLTDVRSGDAFTIESLAGKLVAIEPMAVWCSNCRIQQREAVTALQAVASDDLVYIGLDVDPNEDPAVLAAYADEQGFPWAFSVASVELARSLAEEFGDQVLSPPSTPLILIGPDGTVIESHVGIRRADELEALFRRHLP